MTVAELIEKLQQFPPEHRVFVTGYEGGINDLKQAGLVQVKLDVHPETYYGPHEAIYDSWELNKYGEPDCVGVLLPRGAL